MVEAWWCVENVVIAVAATMVFAESFEAELKTLAGRTIILRGRNKVRKYYEIEYTMAV
jgi:hypothetical protein